jgi:hypothetical protein
MKDELLKELVSLGIKKTKIEAAIGMPKNSLSNFISGKKELPDKWIEPIQKFLASDTVKYNPKTTALLEKVLSQPPFHPEVFNVIKEIEAYCVEISLPLNELVSDHKKLREENKGLKFVVKSLDEQAYVKMEDGSMQKLNNKKEYNAFNNPAFKSKMGIKDK